MKLFLDSARIDEIEHAATCGFVDGVTTNPELLARIETPVEELVPRICERMRGTVSVPASGDDADALVRSGRALAALDDRVLVKLPVHDEGLRALSRLRSLGVRTHATWVYTPNQALLAARCGAFYVSPFVGRVEESGGSGTDLVAQILEIFDNYELETQVMVASVRNPMHVQEAALLGADACTLSWELLQSLSRHPRTDALRRASGGREEE